MSGNIYNQQRKINTNVSTPNLIKNMSDNNIKIKTIDIRDLPNLTNDSKSKVKNAFYMNIGGGSISSLGSKSNQYFKKRVGDFNKSRSNSKIGKTQNKK